MSILPILCIAAALCTILCAALLVKCIWWCFAFFVQYYSTKDTKQHKIHVQCSTTEQRIRNNTKYMYSTVLQHYSTANTEQHKILVQYKEYKTTQNTCTAQSTALEYKEYRTTQNTCTAQYYSTTVQRIQNNTRYLYKEYKTTQNTCTAQYYSTTVQRIQNNTRYLYTKNTKQHKIHVQHSTTALQYKEYRATQNTCTVQYYSTTIQRIQNTRYKQESGRNT
jgi:hypothetical protein